MDPEWPAWATETIVVVAADPSWRDLAEDLTGDLRLRLRPWLQGAVEHIGSTAVPGLAAKPVVDLMAPMASLSSCHRADGVLAEAGWHLVPPELDNRSWRRFYVLPQGGRRVAHLHLVERSRREWRDIIAFRDALRNRPELVVGYAQVKRAAAAAHPADREAYTAAKSAFIEKALHDGG